MDLLQVVTAIKHVYHNVTQFWLIKLAISTAIAALCSLHSKLLIAFAILVVMDLLSKWASLSRQYLHDKRQIDNATFAECILAMPAARRAGYIKSHAMRCRFASKMLAYISLVLGATIVDWAMRSMQRPEFLVVLIVSYLGVTEIISILENMQKAGVDEVQKLKDIIEKKKDKL